MEEKKGFLKKFIGEFKEFTLKGNVMDLAIGVIIGSAFSGLVTSLLNNIISPIIGCFSTGGFKGLSFKFWKANLTYGAFLNDVINFLIMAFVIFLLMKFVNRLMSIGKKEEIAAPTTKKCPYCMTEIDINATRCPHCTSVIEEKNK